MYQFIHIKPMNECLKCILRFGCDATLLFRGESIDSYCDI